MCSPPLVPTVIVLDGIARFVGVGFAQGRAGSFAEQIQVIDLRNASRGGVVFRPEDYNHTCMFMEVCVSILTMEVEAIVYLFCSKLQVVLIGEGEDKCDC